MVYIDSRKNGQIKKARYMWVMNRSGTEFNFIRKRKNTLILLLFMLSFFSFFADAESWLDTHNAPLRADIEQLSRAGIIRVPINTWPLMWSGILNDLERGDSAPRALSLGLENTLARVLAVGHRSTRLNQPQQSLSLSAANQSQLLRQFGDNGRDEAQISLSRSGMTKHLVYNLEISKTVNPWDDEQTHYDNSYFGVVWGNWIAIVGNSEKWWGPGWNSNLILSNNARPTPGLTLQRNYSEPSQWPVLKHLGPWTTNLFISKLDDERHINNAKLVGMSVGLRPLQSLEINLRRAAQWGGEGRPQSAKSFFELVTGLADNCDTSDCRIDEPGNQLGGVDFRWDMPWFNASLYGQRVGEDEAGGLPAKNASQLGLQMSLQSDWFQGIGFIEYDDTSTNSSSQRYNVLYNHSIYQTGYRYQGRSIGSTWDNDSTVTSIGAIGYLNNGDSIEARFSNGELNVDSLDSGVPSRHSISTLGSRFNSLTAKWQRVFDWGDLKLEGRYTDRLIDDFGRQENKLRFAASFDYNF
jgi:hypothetical protein